MAGLLVALTATVAQAHPLGNFSVNHAHHLTIRPDGIDLEAVVDLAEVPTQQERAAIDGDGDGELGPRELQSTAVSWCDDLVAATTTAVDGDAVTWSPRSRDLVAVEGAAGLATLRLTCRLTVAEDLSDGATIDFADAYRGDRVGWHEVTASADGVRLVDPPVPAESVSDRLRTYPDDLLSSPLDVRSVRLDVVAGVGVGVGVGGQAASPTVDRPDADGVVAGVMAAGDRLLEDTIGRDDLTPLVGTAALVLAMLLGAGHAMLPGHGKTVMAAYLAGRDGTRTDALVVGATVTITHTAGVILLGLAITVGSAVIGEVVLQRLALVSGVLVAGIGLGMLRDARRRRRGRVSPVDRPAPVEPVASATSTVATTVRAVPAPTPALVAAADHGHAHGGGGHVHGVQEHPSAAHAHDHGAHDHDSHAHGGHVHSHGGRAHSHGPDRRVGRRGLVGMAVAGGLVPSPSALVVLLGSIALGRTIFGMSLVLAYGVGMAATLTVVGLLLVTLRDRVERLSGGGWWVALVRRGEAVLPVVTSVLVTVVGLVLVARAVWSA